MGIALQPGLVDSITSNLFIGAIYSYSFCGYDEFSINVGVSKLESGFGTTLNIFELLAPLQRQTSLQRNSSTTDSRSPKAQNFPANSLHLQSLYKILMLETQLNNPLNN